jgi:CheY-like chemotaxis protein
MARRLSLVDPGARPAEERPRWPLERPERPDRVLLAEDDPELRRLFAIALRRAGYRVVEARDGGEVIDRLAPGRWNPDDEGFAALVTDVRMPRLSGLDVLAALRSTRWATPVILVSAYVDAETRAEAAELGALALLEKPVPLERLVFTVRQAAARH